MGISSLCKSEAIEQGFISAIRCTTPCGDGYANLSYDRFATPSYVIMPLPALGICYSEL